MTTPRSLHRELGLTDDEFGAIVELLEREPTELELAMYAVMWSEHCSYKSSKRYLSRFPVEAPWVLVGPGEGAGVIDVGDGLAVAIRIESHNHPSAVEPYQGAATGVGGIIRDVFSMGARPIALMDPLRFGPLDEPRTRYLFEGVVSGISGYGNAVGVPTVGGEVVFDECYRDNPLVNVLCLGLLPKERLVLAKAEGTDNLAVLLGSSTGRDGIGGASVLASAGFEEGSEAKRPSVQVGDPFEEKRAIEACLELLDAGLAVGVQDLGAAGISCAASETAAKTGAGMDVDIARVAKREPGMNPVEVMTSESQERMLAIVTPANLDAVLALCERWEIRATVIGRVTDTARFRVFDGLFDAVGVPGANPPAPRGDTDTRRHRRIGSRSPTCRSRASGDGPVYNRPAARPADLDARQAADPAPVLAARFPAGTDLSGELLALLASPTIADKSWVWHQYDHQLFLNTVAGPGSDAAVLRLKGTARALALTTDGAAQFCALDPRVGAQLTVMEAARNVACVGGESARARQLPELRQPRASRSHVAVRGSGRRHERRVPRARHPRRRRQRELLQRVARDATSTPRPWSASSASSSSSTRFPRGRLWSTARTWSCSGPRVRSSVDRNGHDSTISAVVRHRSRISTRPSRCTVSCARSSLERVVAGVHDCAEGGLAVTIAEMAIAGSCGVQLGAVAPDFEPALRSGIASGARVVLGVGLACRARGGARPPRRRARTGRERRGARRRPGRRRRRPSRGRWTPSTCRCPRSPRRLARGHSAAPRPGTGNCVVNATCA